VFQSAQLGARAAARGARQHPPLKEPASWYLANVSAGASATSSNLLSVSFKGSSPAVALGGLHAVVEAYGGVVKASSAAQANAVLAQLNASIASLDTQLAALAAAPTTAATTSQIQQLNDSRAALVARRSQVQAEAAVPSNGISQTLYPNDASTSGIMASFRLIVMAILLGLLVGIGLAYVRSYRHRIFRHARDPELVLAAPLLVDASTLSTAELVGASPGDKARAETVSKEMFAIATSLVLDQRHQPDRRGMSLAVVSALKGPSRNAVAWRSAFAFAAQGLRVLLIDVYGARPPAEDWWSRVADNLTWQERADGRFTLSGQVSSPRGSGWLMAGEPNTKPAVFTRSQQLGLYYCSELPPVKSQRALTDVFLDLETSFDVVLVIAPPFLGAADAAHLTTAAGAVMMVVPDGASVTDHEEVARRLRISGAAVVGYVYCAPETNHVDAPPAPRAPDRAALPAKATSRKRAS
jgi:Mrp family chromosome partitioning ATPase